MASYDEEMGFRSDDEAPEGEPLLAKEDVAPEPLPWFSEWTRDAEDILEEIVEETGGHDVVQFSCPTYFAEETEGMLKVDVIRLGSMQGKVAVMYHCKDVSAKASVNYVCASGQFVFEEDEHTKSFDIPILEDGSWSPTNEFEIALDHPQNCQLGMYLHHCRVKILNTDPFPSEMYEEDIKAVLQGTSTLDHVSMWSLFWEYWKMNYGSVGLKWQTVLVLVMDQLSNLLLFGTLWIGVYIVDTIFAGQGSSHRLLVSDRYTTATIIAVWYVIPSVLLYGWDCAKTYIDIKGATRELLQISLLKSFFDYSLESRSRVTPSEITAAIDLNADQVADGYVAVLNIAGLVGKIITVEIFIVLFQPDKLAILSVFAMVLLLMVFTATQARVSQRAQERVEEQHVLVDLVVDEATRKFQLVLDYSKRSVISDAFAVAVRSFSKEKIPETIARLNTRYTTKFLSGIFIAIYIVAKTPAVLDHELSLGVFLATITIFGTYLADAITDLNQQLMFIIDAFAPLKDFTKYLNLELNLLELKKVNRARRGHTHEKRLSLFSATDVDDTFLPSEAKTTTFKSDLIPIEVNDVSFEYIPGIPVLIGVDLAIPQGTMVAVTGPHMAGKSTFIELLASTLCPTKGTIMIPSHLRVLHVTRVPVFLRASLLSNLCLGLARHASIDLDHIKGIMKLCGVSELIKALDDEIASEHGNAKGGKLFNEEIKYSDESHHGHTWQKSLTQSQQVRLHIARALIANPNVIIMHHSLDGLHGDSALEILAVLRTHVNERGLCLPKIADINKRRPRNVFYTTESADQAMKADMILEMDPESKSVMRKTGTPRELT